MVYQSELRPWLIDTLNFMIEQLNQARVPSEQLVAVDAVAGLLPYLLVRLKEDTTIAAHFALALDVWIDPNHAKRVWNLLANEPPATFAQSANDLIQRLEILETIVRSTPA